jgi:hypothetical protein
MKFNIRVVECFAKIITAGSYHIKWEETDKTGNRISAGTYFCKLHDQNTKRSSIKKFVIP